MSLIHMKPIVNYLAANEGKNLGILKKHLPAAIGIWMTSFYAVNNLASKKIPSERKPTLLINDIITCAIGVLGGYAISDGIFRFQRAVVDRFNAEIAKTVANPGKRAMLTKGLSSIIPLVAFTMTFRYIGPVLATPLADKVTKFLVKKGWMKDPDGASKQAKQAKAAEEQVAVAAAQIAKDKPVGQNFDMSVIGTVQMTPGFQNFLNDYFAKHQ